MKNWIIITLLLTLGFGANAGEFEEQLDHFTNIKAAGNFKVTLKKGEKEMATIINEDANVDDDKIILEVEEDELSIRIKGDTYKERVLEIVIIYVELESVTSKLGCRLTIDDSLSTDKIEFISDSGGKIRATVAAKKLFATVSAGGSIHLDGAANTAYYKVKAGGTIGAVSVQADKVEATVKAGGEIICSVENDLSIKITSGGSVSYFGDPEGYEQNITLGGKIHKMSKTK